MAAFSGRDRHKLAGICVCITYLLLLSITFASSLNLPQNEIKLTISEYAETGTTVLKDDLISEECTQIKHIQRKRSVPLKPFRIDIDGSLVLQSSLKNLSGDIFVIHIKELDCKEVRSASVSHRAPVHIEVVPNHNFLSFMKPSYTGTINKNSVYGTQVEGLSNLYACSLDECENNLDYRITGSDSFFLETYSQNGRIQLSIHSKGPLSIEKASYHFIIIAENSDGQQGHTNVEVDNLATHHTLDTNLRFRPSGQTQHRHRRQTAETNPDQTVAETASGQLFSVAVAGSPNYRYSLKSSTYKNAFTVSVTGAVSVAPGFKLDYETYVPANNGSNRIRLEITVTDSTLPQGNSKYISTKNLYIICMFVKN
ncbi:hypothetical protein DPMN_007495 [Dreissena polymorpha]|uniref:Cadherin domain-containing protein n=1 Tax=Dreissena polymorpha TaxID=45954 RepID=A0A9D4MVY9_DREPO|nr:hypothetical protein DPMN_007495 [Dreissena polymorpha]